MSTGYQTGGDMLPFCKKTLRAIKPKPSTYPKSLDTICDHLRQKRLDLGLRHRDIAELMGVNVNTTESWENHHHFPEEKHVAKIIEFLGYNPIPKGETIGEQLYHFRLTNGYSRVEIGKIIGADDMSIVRWEKNEYLPSKRYLKLLKELINGKLILDGS